VFWYRLITVINWNYDQAQKEQCHNAQRRNNTKLFKISLLVIMKVAKPAAVVKLVIKVAVPTLVITLCSSFICRERYILVGTY
jgi:hypothetical protein